MKKSIFSRGFTLVELLVVIAIIGILATLLLLQLNVARQKARDTKRVADVTQLRTAIELYYDDNGSYPTSAEYTAASLGKYLANSTALPKDPTLGTDYGYAYDGSSKPNKYQIWAQLENPGNQDSATAGVLGGDSDIISTGWGGSNGTGKVDGTKEGGTSGKCTTGDCVFDLGVQ